MRVYIYCVIGIIACSPPPGAAQDSPRTANAGSLGDMTLHIIPQSHIDLAWWWRYDPQTIDIVAKHTLETAYGNMEKYPDYTFTFLQVPAIEPLESRYPDLFYKLRFYVHAPRGMGERIPNPGAGGAKGRLAIGSAAWCEFDGCLPCGESLIRQFMYGKRYFLREFGIDVKTAWVQDAWTHPWTLPQILKKCGVDSYMYSRPRGEGEQMFWWEAPDGSRVFAYKPLDTGGESLPTQDELNVRMRDMKNRYGVSDDITLTGVGNHGGGPIRADVERMRSFMAKRESTVEALKPPKMIFSTPQRFVDAVLSAPHNFPVVKYELAPTIRGAYTTAGEIKKGNRRSECVLITLEKFAAIASRLGERAYPQATIFEGWKKVMLNQFHDTISGTEMPAALDDSLSRFSQVIENGNAELDSTFDAIAARVDTRGPSMPVIVFNPLAWDRTDIVEVELPCDASPASVVLTDKTGARRDGQILRERVVRGEHTVTVAFIADAIPSLGYKTYWSALSSSRRTHESPLKCGAEELENEFFEIQIDPATGCLLSVLDKKANRQVLAATGRGNLIQLLEDFGDSEGFLKSSEGVKEHNIWTGKSWDVDMKPAIRVVEGGPVRAAIEVKHQFELARFTQRITIYAGVPRIDFELIVHWTGKNKMVKVAFPLAVTNPEATYEIPYGTIRRPSNGEEEAAQNWVDISADGFGVSLLNDSRYGYDVTPNTIRLSVLRSPTAPVFSTDEKEAHEIRYALYPHAGSWETAQTVREGHALNNPLIAVAAAAHAGDLPAVHSFVQVAPENVILSALKKSEDGDDVILRTYETEGKASAIQVTLSPVLKADAVYLTDMLENGLKEMPSKSSGFTAEAGASSIDTFRLIRD